MFTVGGCERLCGHEKKLEKDASRSEVCQHFFSNCVVNDWNGLDSTVAMAPSLDILENAWS